MELIVIVILLIIVYYIVDRISESKYLKENPFDTKFKILVDELGSRLYEGIEVRLLKKSDRYYILKRINTPGFISQIDILYRKNSIYMKFNENLMGGTKIFSEKYLNVPDVISEEQQLKMAKDFISKVF